MGFDKLKYNVTKNAVIFMCRGIEEGGQYALFDEFFLDLSKGRRTFFSGYRLFEPDAAIDPAAVVAKSGVLLDKFTAIYHLSEAAVKSAGFNTATSVDMYFFDPKVEWSDFLATMPILGTKGLLGNLMDYDLLSACFSSQKQGSLFSFICGKQHEKQVFAFFEKLSAAGWKVEESKKVAFA